MKIPQLKFDTSQTGMMKVKILTKDNAKLAAELPV